MTNMYLEINFNQLTENQDYIIDTVYGRLIKNYGSYIIKDELKNNILRFTLTNPFYYEDIAKLFQQYNLHIDRFRFHPVVFFQGEEANEYLDMIDNKGDSETVDSL